MSKQFWAVIVIIVLVLIGVFVATNNNSGSGSNSKTNAQLSNHVEGQGTTGVKLVEYGDYECPVCEAYFPVLQQVFQEYQQQIFFQFRNFPLTQVHPNAFAGARAAEAAALQGKFWQMHDTLYDPNNWEQWSTSSNPVPFFDQYAQQLGLNVTQFENDFKSSKVNNTVTADMNEGNKLGIQGTPTFYLDGKEVSNSKLADNNGPSLKKFENVLNAEIKAKTSAGSKTGASSTSK